MEMFRTFNCGLGMVLIVSKHHLEEVQNRLNDENEVVFQIGNVISKIEGGSSVEIEHFQESFDFPLPRKIVTKIRVGVLISGTGSKKF